MDIAKLEINNFLTVGNAVIELDTRGLLLIQGENKDDPSAESNGAGKSSIVDALCWAIYGVTARGVTADSVVNRTAKKNCWVQVTIEDGAHQYVITRYRKDSAFKNQVTVLQLTSGSTIKVDMSKGTDKETQEVINQVIGCSLEVFMASVYCGQERMPDLPGMTDKQLKLLIEEAAGVEILSAAYTVARNKLTSVKARLDAVIPSHKAAEANLSEAIASLADFQLESAKFDDERKARAKAELVKTLPLKQEIAELEAMLEPSESLTKQIADLDDTLKMQKHEQSELILLERGTNSAQNETTRLRANVQNGKAKLEGMNKALAEIDERVGTPCGECGKAYHEDDLETAKEAQRLAIAKYKPELLALASSFKAASEAHSIASDAAEKFKVSMTDFTAVGALQRDLSGRLMTVRVTEGKIVGKTKEIVSIGSVAKSKLTEANPWEKSVESKMADIDRIKKTIELYAKEVEDLTAKTELLDGAVRVFGPAGVRAHILDTVTPYLNERTREYLGALTDGNIHAEWNTLSKTAKGDLKEKFNIEVTNDEGADSFAGLSGGEKRKVRLSTALALQDMVAGRASKPINIFIGDEIDHALDESGLERLMTVLERKARERGTVLVISHNSLSDWIDNVITVTKSGKLSTVSGATERGF